MTLESMEDEATWLKSMEFTGRMIALMAFKAVLQLDIFGIIASFGPEANVSAAQIASRLPQQNPDTCVVLDKMLRVMVAHSFLTASAASGELLYGLAPASKHFSSDGTHGTLSFIHQFVSHRVIFGACDGMKDRVLKGDNTVQLYDLFSQDDELRSLFVNAMAGIAAFAMPDFVRRYKGFDGLSSVVDVGGCNGEMMGNVVSKYPSIKGINFDLPCVIQQAPNRPGVENVGGDMFESVPEADAVILKSVLHNWKDDDCVAILKNCWKAIPDGGKVIVIDSMLPEVPDSSVESQHVGILSLLMTMIHTGKERSQEEISVLGMKAGFRKFLFAVKVCGIWTALELFK